MKLFGSSDVQRRVEFLSTLYNKADEKMLHIDGMRQTNMNYALLVFGGLYGLGIKLNGSLSQLYISIVIVIVMGIFTFWDRRLHKYRHGWESTRSFFFQSLAEIINNPNEDIELVVYDVNGEKQAEWLSAQPLIYYLLIIGGILSFFIFPFVSSKG